MNILGLVGYDGLVIVDTTAFPRPVQIMIQTISNLETQICRISPYQRYEGLSSPLKNQGIKKDTHISWYNKPYRGKYSGLADMKVLKEIRF